MKVDELFLKEMAFSAGDWTHEFTPQQLTNAFMHAKEVTKLEGGKYSIKQKDLDFALYSGNNFLSLLKIKPASIKGVDYDSVVLIYTPKENRKLGYSTILLYALKELRKNPILFDGPIFTDGWSFLKNIANNHSSKFQSVKMLNKTTGVVSDFEDKSPKKNQAFIVENDEMGFYMDLGNMGPVYYNMFKDILKG